MSNQREKKPSQWALTAAGTRPEWNWFWDSAILAVPIWYAPVYDVAPTVGRDYLVSYPGPQYAAAAGTLTNTKFKFFNLGLAFENPGTSPDAGGFSFGTSPLGFYEFLDHDEFTVEAIFDTYNNAIGFQSLIMDWGATEGAFHFSIASGKVSLYVRNAADAASDNLDGATSLTNFVEHHVAATFSRGVFNVYLDGIKDAAEKTSGTVTDIFSDATLNKTIGCKSDNNNPIRGRMHFAALHKRAFTPAEIFLRAQDPFGPFRMDEDVGTVLTSVTPDTGRQWMNPAGGMQVTIPSA